MNFKTAFNMAMENSEFSAHVVKVQNCIDNGDISACIMFSIGSESFFYGFDGIKLHAGKHPEKRALVLISRGNTLVIA